MKNNHCPTCFADLPQSHKLNLPTTNWCECGLLKEKLGYHKCKSSDFTTKKMKEFNKLFYDHTYFVVMDDKRRLNLHLEDFLSQSIFQAQEAQKEQTRKEIEKQIIEKQKTVRLEQFTVNIILDIIKN